MSDHYIDKIFRAKLTDGTMTVPENLWKTIEPHLPSQHKRDRWGLIWFFGAGGLLISAIAAWWILTGVSESVETQSSETEVTSLTTPSSDVSSDVAANTPTQLSSSSIALAANSSSNLLSQFSPSRSSGQSKDVVPLMNTGTDVSTQNDRATPTESESTDTLDLVRKSLPAVASFSVLNSRTHFIDLRTSPMLLTYPILRKLPDPAKDCYRFGKKNSGSGGVLFAEAYAGPGFASRNLSSRSEDVSSYIISRDSTEASRLSWNAGLRLGYWHHSGITVRIGGHYTQVNELFEYFNGSSTGSIIISDTIRDAQGNIIEIRPDTILVSGQRFIKTHNRYHTIDIPLLLGYQVAHGNWTYGMHAGPVFNVAFIRKGDILAPDGKPVSISGNDANEYPAFRDKLGLSIYGSAHIGYRIGYRMWLYGEPYVHHRLNSLTLDSYPIDQRQTNIGLSVGLRVTL
ncbi:MAG TPA: hypothetical protein VI603_14495 [Saprospiraceae bacterium]|nr:hypothetical protein [Saprospiraceae bacterium]